MGFIAVGLVGLMGSLGFCVFYLAFAPRWRVAVRVAVAGTVVLVIVVSMVSMLLRRLDYPMAAWRPVTVVALSALPVVAYVTLGLAGVAVIDLVWRGAARVHGAAAVRLPRADGTGAATSAHRGGGSVPGPRSDGPTAAGGASGGALPHRVVWLRWATCLVTAVAVGFTGFGYVRAHAPAITPVTVVSAQLPAAFDGYRIALLTDLHLGPGLSGSFLRHVVDETNAASPDLVVIAGDLVDGTVDELAGELAPLADLLAPDGVVVVTGNHEFFTGMPSAWMAAYRSLGLTVLDNEGVVLRRGEATIDVLGVGDRLGVGALAPDLALADRRLREAAGPPSPFRILAVHEPLQVLADGLDLVAPVDGEGLAATLGIDLALCGHTHGGQIWPTPALVRLQQPVLDGVHDLAGVTTVTSRGAGAWGPPVRIGAPPEIPLVTLRVAA